MTLLTLTWLALPLAAGIAAYLAPRAASPLALACASASGLFAMRLFREASPLSLRLLDHFGVGLMLDPLAGFFILTNALVTAAVVLFCRQGSRPPFFYAQILMLHGSLNASFACADFISLYVALEVISIAAFLLITHPRTDRTIWVGLRYLFVGNVAMLFYLVGAVLVYQATHTFDYAGLRSAPPEAFALIFLGLLVKGGIFVSGWWLPLTHAESEPPVSALLSGIVVKAAVLALIRCAAVPGGFDPIVRFLGLGAALLGVLYAVLETDTKRLLAFSTISQLGFILAAPEVGGFYALTHGLVKAALFLAAGILPERDFRRLRHRPIPTPVWWVLLAAGFSISGVPLLSGFGAKVLTMKHLYAWQTVAMNLAALGTATAFAKFIFLPHGLPHGRGADAGRPPVHPGGWAAFFLLFGGLLAPASCTARLIPSRMSSSPSLPSWWDGWPIS